MKTLSNIISSVALITALVLFTPTHSRLISNIVYPNADAQQGSGGCLARDSYDVYNNGPLLGIPVSSLTSQQVTQAVVQMYGFSCATGYMSLRVNRGSFSDAQCNPSDISYIGAMMPSVDSNCFSQFDITSYVRWTIDAGKSQVILNPSSSNFNFNIYGHNHWTANNPQQPNTGYYMVVYSQDTTSTPQLSIDPFNPNIIYGLYDSSYRGSVCATRNTYDLSTVEYVGISVPVTSITSNFQSAQLVMVGSSCDPNVQVRFTSGYGQFGDFECNGFYGNYVSTRTVEQGTCTVRVDVSDAVRRAISNNQPHVVSRVGGYLASIVTWKLNSYIQSITPNTCAEFWIGGSRASSSSAFKWDDSRTFAYSNFDANHPKNNNNYISYIRSNAFGTIGKWRSITNDYKKPFLCEKKKQVATTTAAPTLAPCPDGYVRYATYCYKLYTSPTLFSDASNACRRDGGYLASILTWQTNAWIKEFVQNQVAQFWIGGYRASNNVAFKWDDYRTWAYTNFEDGQPSSGNGENYVAFNEATGKWSTTLSSDKKAYLCEHL
ncbi:C-type mannose receptor [Acrasis kona]|uniref:C-type mannose receptor n=1 Tax=Acrasis kona TaxID=1008807 RepID=A0AAW2ZMA5_9EUKA